MLNQIRKYGLPALIAAVALIAAACGDAEADGAASAALPLSVGGLVEAEPEGVVPVIGFLVIDSSGSRLCSALAESSPPRCGGESIEISGVDVMDVDFVEKEGVSWTDTAVVVDGLYSNGSFPAQGNA